MKLFKILFLALWLTSLNQSEAQPLRCVSVLVHEAEEKVDLRISSGSQLKVLFQNGEVATRNDLIAGLDEYLHSAHLLYRSVDIAKVEEKLWNPDFFDSKDARLKDIVADNIEVHHPTACECTSGASAT